MSLIVAKLIKNKVIVCSDTKLSSNSFDENNPKDGTVKTIILTNNIAICFAGKVYFAEIALKEIGSLNNFDEIKNILLSYHLDSNQETDFICILGSSSPELFEIKSGKCTSVLVSWIGSYEGYKVYQETFLESKGTDISRFNGVSLSLLKIPDTDDKIFTQLFKKSFSAIKSVIDDGKIVEVGGFAIMLTYYKGSFQFESYTESFRKPLDIEVEGEGPIKFGNVKDGSYSINFAESKKIVALHINCARLGIVYSRDGFGLCNPKMYTNIDEIDFSEFIRINYSTLLAIGMGQSPVNFFLNASNKYNIGNYNLALERIDTGVKLLSKNWSKKNLEYSSISLYLKNHSNLKIKNDEMELLSKLFHLRAVCLFELKFFEDSIRSFDESLIMNQDFALQDRKYVCKILTQLRGKNLLSRKDSFAYHNIQRKRYDSEYLPLKMQINKD